MEDPGLRFRLLGPLEVLGGQAPVALPHGKERALLAILLLQRGRPVAGDALIEALWGEDAPASARNSVHVYVSHLRKQLGPRLVTRGHQYVLELEPGALDIVEFERLAAEGRRRLEAGDADAASAALREALAIWRGPALADFCYDAFAQEEIRRLDDLRLTALEDRVDADLSAGHHAELTAELSALVAQHPLRERLQGQLMLALYRAGRQADALEVFRQARAATVSELGIEPTPALRELHAAILRQDPSLAHSRIATARARALHRRGARLLIAGAAALLLAVAGTIALLARDRSAVGAVRPLESASCSPMRYAPGARPHLLVIGDQALQGEEAQLGNQVAESIEYVLRAHHYAAGRYRIGYQACDDSTQSEGGAETAKCAANARAYAGNPGVVAVVGPTLSVCAAAQLAILGRAPGGPVALVSPSNTRVGLTRAGPGTQSGEPGRYYPHAVRHYVRLLAADDFQAAADAMLAKRLGLRRVYVLSEASEPGVAGAFRGAATKLGITIAGSGRWIGGDPAAYADIARTAARSGADGVFLAGPLSAGGVDLLRAVRRAGSQRKPLLASDGFAVPELLRESGRPANGLRISVAGIAPEALRGRGRRLVDELHRALGEQPHLFSVYAAQATELLLDAIGRSDGTRASVVHELFASRVRGGILGDFDVTASGDTTSNQVTIYRVAGGRLRLERVLDPPLSLVAGP